VRVTVDRDRCVGSGTCVFTAPGVFDQDEQDGRVVLTGGRPEPAAFDAVRRARANCPVGAITLVEHDGPPGSD
jgi:ferredoxin